MTATEIIAEIKALPPKGREQVLQFVQSLESGEELSGAELSDLAEKLAVSEDGTESADLRAALLRGFYGK
jgi:uncharacterized protein YfaS (alpha-2-macroglobulin family)